MAEKLLMEVNDNVELFLYEGILKQNKIPYVIKRPNVRGYMKILTGAAHAVPAEIYVPEEAYEQVLELTEIIRSEKSTGPGSKGDPLAKRKSVAAWIIVGIFAVLLITALATGFFKT